MEMKYYLKIFAGLFISLLMFACSPNEPVNPPDGPDKPVDPIEDDFLPELGSGETDGYKLVWEDLFNDETLDPNRWYIEVNGDGGGNAELQYYREENVSVGKEPETGRGCLVLTAKKENFGGRNVTSGRVNSNNRVTVTHGKIEASIKLPLTANGLWPAFWMMGNNYFEVGWPRCGEIDIMEFGHSNGMKNGKQDRYFNGACHWGVRWDQVASYAKDHTAPYGLQDDFHLYTFIWTEESAKMYLDLDKNPDANPYYEMNINGYDAENSPGHYFHKPFFILFNLAVGGNFPGIWEIDKITALNESNNFEAKMYIDYIKVYQKGEEGDQLYLK
jgi:beta-glucanase (GH16 family)